MRVEVLLDLMLGLGDETEAEAIAPEPGQCPDDEGAAVPERVEPAGVTAKGIDPLGAPGEMIELFLRGSLHERARRGLAGDQRLTAVQRLRGDLARVVDAH